MDKVAWFELPADDTQRASDFYEKTFGWNMSDMGPGSKMAITAQSDDQGQPIQNGAINGDISQRTDTFTQPTIVIEVSDINDRIAKAEAAGGRVVKPAEKLDGMNAMFALVADTEGNVVGLLQDL
jgi:predicted enzyme related to lactoylglutathione lyase